MFNIAKKRIGWETLRDTVNFTWDSTFVDAMGPRDAIEIKPKSNTVYTYTLWHSHPPIWNSATNFLVQESHEMRPRKILMHRMVIWWVIYIGRHRHRAKNPTCPSRESTGILSTSITLSKSASTARQKKCIIYLETVTFVFYTPLEWQILLAWPKGHIVIFHRKESTDKAEKNARRIYI